MFVRYRKIKDGKTRVQIVENYRDKDKVVQKVLRHVGTAQNEEELKEFVQIAEHLKDTIEAELCPKLFTTEQLPEKKLKNRKEHIEAEMPMLVNLNNIREEKRIITGFHEIYGSLFDEVGYNNVLKSKKISNEIFKDIVMARLAKPVSKRSSCEMLSEQFGIEHDLSQVYRMMDALISENKTSKKVKVKIDKIPEIQNLTTQYTKQLLNGTVTIFFYDCTTLYFESFSEDELRRFGYSKDNKFNQGQVLLSLMVANEGLPFGFDTFPGNMYEGDTFKIAINTLKEKYTIKEGIIVADSGLLSKNNMQVLKDSGFQYILGARLKNLPENWQQTILNNTEYDETRTIYYQEQEGELKDTLKIKVYDYEENRKKNKKENNHQRETKYRLIISRSDIRARKDKNDRDKALEKLELKLKKSKNPTNLISNYGYKKYMQIEGDSNVSVNQEKISQAALWDGLHGVFTNTNRNTINAYAVLEAYHGLWQVEDSFRVNKHDIRMRPVFHWNPNRIRAHIAICYVAFSLIRFLQYRIKHEINERFSASRISIELNSVQESILCDINNKNKKYVIPSKLSDNVLKIYKSMKIHKSSVPYRLRE